MVISKYVLVNPKKRSKQTAEKLEELLDIDEVQNSERGSWTEVLSPDKSRAVFIKDWNLWMRDTKTGLETQLTKDGVENYGYATDNAGWRKSKRPIILWSPDSKKIATFQQDQRHVNDMYLVETKVGKPYLQTWKYPLPEDEKVIQIERVIIHVDEAKVVRLNISADPRRGTLCDDIACTGSFDDNEWNSESTQLVFVSTSRDHKNEKIRIADAFTGDVRRNILRNRRNPI
jgi:dipeptidyl-peptidase-4